MTNSKTEQDVAFIRALAQILNEGDLGEIEVEREYGEDDELKVRLARKPDPAPIYAAPASIAAAPPPPAAPPQAAPAVAAPQETSADPASAPGMVPSPMVGTVYLAPEPGAAPFVGVGDQVSEGQTVLIIEAMKTMNQIPAPRAGKITQMLVSDAEPVEYGSPLLIIE